MKLPRLLSPLVGRLVRWSPAIRLLSGVDPRVRFVEVDVGGIPYKAAEVIKAGLFTDRTNNISFLSGRRLVPHVSWQYESNETVGDSKNHLVTGAIRLPLKFRRVHAPVASLLTGGGGNHNYFHWMCDCLPRIQILQAAFPDVRDAMYWVPDLSRAFQRDTLGALGLKQDQLLSSADATFLRTDRGFAVSPPIPDPECVPRWVPHFLRETFLPHAAPRAFGPRVFISREDTFYGRRLLNETHVAQVLVQEGFQVCRLSELSFAEQVALFSAARLVVTVHGAGLTNLVFCQKGAEIHELFADSYQPQMYRQIAAHMDLLHVPVACETVAAPGVLRAADVRLSDSQLAEIVARSRRLSQNS
ncbi:MAG: glycosyltransferase family 61 protein [Terrimicrobiaceae bacterium]|nr:glycosyltransferase family 61 protein [Terrimicrobiaceae bacterium]